MQWSQHKATFTPTIFFRTFNYISESILSFITIHAFFYESLSLEVSWKEYTVALCKLIIEITKSKYCRFCFG